MVAVRLTRKEKQEQTRAALLRSAAELFAAGGVEGTSLETIARHAGVTQGAIYSNFASKAELWRALADELDRTLDLEAFFHPQQSLRDELAELGRAIWRILQSTDRTDLLLAEEFDLFLIRDRNEGARYRRTMRAERRDLAQLLERSALQRGEPLPMPAIRLAHAIEAVAEGVRHLFMLDPRSVDEELCVALFTALAVS